MRKIIMLLILVTSLSSYAQTKTGKVAGSIHDDEKKNAVSATVSLLRTDSSVFKMNAVDKNGQFLFENIEDGKFLISVTAVGAQKAYSNVFEIKDGSSVTLKTIQLVPQSKDLSAVTVTAKKPLIEQKIDRTVVNVEASVTNVGSSALEVLEKSPGITVDKDGNISLKGKAGVVVLVDGRPTQLGGTDLANMLRNLNASQLDQIEIMTNPPAKYDAAGNAGIINIKTKKNKQVGYNGTASVNYGQGRYPKINESLNFNYRAGKVNLFTNLSHGYRKNYENLNIQRNFINETTKEITSHFDQQARMQNKGVSFNGKLGMDYFASKNTTFGVVLSGFTNDFNFHNNTNILRYDAAANFIGRTTAKTASDNKFNNFSTNLNFRQLLDTTGKELTADLDYVIYDGKDNMNLSNYYFDHLGNKASNSDTLFGYLPQNIKIMSGKADYLHPLKNGARFEAGVKVSLIRTLNNAQYDIMSNGVTHRDLGRSNDFDYEENINAAYVNLNTNLSKKISAQFGLRLENTYSTGHSTGFVFNSIQDRFVSFDTTFENNYTQLFPTAYFQYKMNDKNNFGLNYGRRIRRPNYENLNPFIEFIDRYTYQRGNPNLKPQFSHNIELTHTYRNFLTTTVNYTKTTDIIQQILEQDNAKNETYMTHGNIAKQRQWGLSVNAGIPITKWWTSNIYVNVSNNRFEGIVNRAFVSVDATMMSLNGSQQFKFSKNTSAEISGFFRTGGLDGVLRTRTMGSASVGLSHTILKGAGSLRLNVRDVFYTQVFKGESKYANIDAAFQNSRDSRVATIGFTYRFSKGKMNGGPKRRAGSASDEQSRVSGGSGN